MQQKNLSPQHNTLSIRCEFEHMNGCKPIAYLLHLMWNLSICYLVLNSSYKEFLFAIFFFYYLHCVLLLVLLWLLLLADASFFIYLSLSSIALLFMAAYKLFIVGLYFKSQFHSFQLTIIKPRRKLTCLVPCSTYFSVCVVHFLWVFFLCFCSVSQILFAFNFGAHCG